MHLDTIDGTAITAVAQVFRHLDQRRLWNLPQILLTSTSWRNRFCFGGATKQGPGDWSPTLSDRTIA